VLKRLADLMERATSRAGEVVGRYGGEEFILVLPGAGEEAARRTAERLRELVMAEKILHKNSQVVDIITISQGVVTFTPDVDESPSGLIKRADNALYRAKHQGRNAIVLAGDPQSEESLKR
jgi:diguanylate cyclase (GGDEF)-like protein